MQYMRSYTVYELIYSVMEDKRFIYEKLPTEKSVQLGVLPSFYSHESADRSICSDRSKHSNVADG